MAQATTQAQRGHGAVPDTTASPSVAPDSPEAARAILEDRIEGVLVDDDGSASKLQMKLWGAVRRIAERTYRNDTDQAGVSVYELVDELGYHIRRRVVEFGQEHPELVR